MNSNDSMTRMPEESAKEAASKSRSEFPDRPAPSKFEQNGVPSKPSFASSDHIDPTAFISTQSILLANTDECGKESSSSIATPRDNPYSAQAINLEFLTPSDNPEMIGRLGNYEILGVVGCGAFGIVLKAFDAALRRIVAIKVLKPELAATSPARKRFLREAKASASVRHENIIHVYAVGEMPLPHLVMEFVPGQSMQQRIDSQIRLSTNQILQMGAQIAEGLAAAHAIGLIHRDIKPSNLLLESGTDRVMITDFGLARAVDDATITQSGVIAGTPMYMSPEQALGETIDYRTDLFSLGSVLYAISVGKPPFRASTTFAVLKQVAEEQPSPVSETDGTVPVWLREIIWKLLSKKPDDRFQSATELAELFHRCQSDLRRGSVPIIPKFNSMIGRFAHWLSRPPIWTAFAFCMLVAYVLWTSMGWYRVAFSLQEDSQTRESAEVPSGPMEFRLGPLLSERRMGDGKFRNVAFDETSDVITLHAEGRSPNLWIDFWEAKGKSVTVDVKLRVLTPTNDGFAKLVFKDEFGGEYFVLLSNRLDAHRVWIEEPNRQKLDEEGVIIHEIARSEWVTMKFDVSETQCSLYVDGELVIQRQKNTSGSGYIAIGCGNWWCEMKNLRATTH